MRGSGAGGHGRQGEQRRQGRKSLFLRSNESSNSPFDEKPTPMRGTSPPHPFGFATLPS